MNSCGPVTRLADAESDAEWAARGGNVALDLERLARNQVKPTSAEYAKQHAARSVRIWWDENKKFLNIRGQFAAVDGAIIETQLNKMIDRMRPAKGQAWAARDQRGADALVELCRNYADVDAAVHGAAKPLFSVSVPLTGPADVRRHPVARLDGRSLRGVGEPRTHPRRRPRRSRHDRTRQQPRCRTRSPARSRLRDGHCRWPGCDRRTGLQVHHLWPRSWGGTDDIANLAAVCVGGGTDHHAQLVPHGHLLLLGNPNQPDGLRLITRDQLAEHANAPPIAAAIRTHHLTRPSTPVSSNDWRESAP